MCPVPLFEKFVLQLTLFLVLLKSRDLGTLRFSAMLEGTDQLQPIFYTPDSCLVGDVPCFLLGFLINLKKNKVMDEMVHI